MQSLEPSAKSGPVGCITPFGDDPPVAGGHDLSPDIDRPPETNAFEHMARLIQDGKRIDNDSQGRENARRRELANSGTAGV